VITSFTQRYNASMYNYLQYGSVISSSWFSSFIEGASFVNTTENRQALNVYPASMPIYEANPEFFAAFYSDVPKSITSVRSHIITLQISMSSSSLISLLVHCTSVRSQTNVVIQRPIGLVLERSWTTQVVASYRMEWTIGFQPVYSKRTYSRRYSWVCHVPLKLSKTNTHSILTLYWIKQVSYRHSSSLGSKLSGSQLCGHSR